MPSVNYTSGGTRFQNNISASGTSTVYTVPANTFASITIVANLNIVTAAPYTISGKGTVPGTSANVNVSINGLPIYRWSGADGASISGSFILVVNMQVGPGTSITTGVGGDAATKTSNVYVFGLTFQS